MPRRPQRGQRSHSAAGSAARGGHLLLARLRRLRWRMVMSLGRDPDCASAASCSSASLRHAERQSRQCGA